MVAVTFAVVTVTDVATSTAFDSVIVKVTPFPSIAETFAMLNTALSLLVIVPVAEPAVPEIVTLRPPSIRPASVAVNVSSTSTVVSAVVLTVMV